MSDPDDARPSERPEMDPLAVASQFVRDVIDALGFEQPALDAVISLEEVRLQLVGQLEEFKVNAEVDASRLRAQAARIEELQDDFNGMEASYHVKCDELTAAEASLAALTGNPALYEVAKRTCHEQGLPWTDPRTGVTYPPPPKGAGS